MATALYAIAAVLFVIVLAMVFAPNRQLETVIVIDAGRERVWEVLADGEAYADWNPFIRRMEGDLAPGNRLRNVLQSSPDSQMTFRPTVLVVEPARELRWLGRLFVPRLFDGEHYFVLEDAAEGATRLVHGEHFRGLLLWFMDAEQFRGNFEAMNEALKQRVEEGG